MFGAVALVLAVMLAIALIYYRRPKTWSTPSKKHLENTIDNALYFRKLNALDLKARGQTSIEAYVTAYKKSMLGFSKAESKQLDDLIARADELCARYPRLSAIEWTIAKFEGVEENFPHTLGDIVFLPSDFFEKPFEEKVETLIHEKLHVYQRTHPIETSILVDKLGFKPWKPQTKITNLRTNPDTNDFAYKLGTIAQAQTYENDSPASIADSRTTVLEGSSDGWHLPESIKQRDHPYEIMASSIASVFVGRADPFDGILTSWMKKHL